MPYPLWKKILLGPPIRPEKIKEEKVSPFLGLALFSSDALSSVAYATEEILLALIIAGPFIFSISLPIAGAIIALIFVVVFSYRQTIQAYPQGGGGYLVAKGNLGVHAGLVAASALLIDYLLTVAVSVSAGIAAITSAFPSLFEYKALLGVTVIVFITVINLRGIKQSSKIFAAPTYFFILSMAALIVIGVVKYFFYGSASSPAAVLKESGEVLKNVSLFIMLKAFASGCTALTGIEAVTSGVGAFKDPTAVNAKKVLMRLACLLAFLFLGITLLAYLYNAYPHEGETVLSQIASKIFSRNYIYYLVQAATAIILLLAANTAFADFPRVVFFLAKDSFLPRQFTHYGDRHVFSNGTIFLGFLASIVILIFNGTTHKLIPLYAVGVFLSFTLSQAGMTLKKVKEKANFLNIFISGFGAATTFVVLAVIVSMKFLQGAVLVTIAIPLLVLLFKWVSSKYANFDKKSMVENYEYPPRPEHTMILLVGERIHLGVSHAIDYIRTSNPKRVIAFHIADSRQAAKEMTAKWKKFNSDIKLKIRVTPRPSGFSEVLLKYIEEIDRKFASDIISVVLTEVVPEKLKEHVLHGQHGWYIKWTLWQSGRRVAIINLPYHISG